MIKKIVFNALILMSGIALGIDIDKEIREGIKAIQESERKNPWPTFYMMNKSAQKDITERQEFELSQSGFGSLGSKLNLSDESAQEYIKEQQKLERENNNKRNHPSAAERTFGRGKDLTEQEIQKHIASLQASVCEKNKLGILLKDEFKSQICRNERGLVTKIFVSNDNAEFALCFDGSESDVSIRARIENQAEFFSKNHSFIDVRNDRELCYWRQAYIMYTIEQLKKGKTIEEVIKAQKIKIPWNDQLLMAFFHVAKTSAGFEGQRRVISEYWKSQGME